jgi:folate-dependent phosphoribosylglycinamide formyltransferase PurN
MMDPIYQPTLGHKMRVAVLFSGGASALQYLLKNDPNLNKKYEFVDAFTNTKTASGIELAQRAGIPVEILDYRDFIRERNKKFSDPGVRKEYFWHVVSILEKWQPDLIIHSGFMLIATEPYLSHFKNKILNVHPADLTLLDGQGKRKYAGLNVVEKAFEARETSTRSTIHLVTEGVDEGHIITLSEPLKIEPGLSPQEHQEKMKWACDGPAYQKALELIADGRVTIDPETGKVSISKSN